MTIGQASSLNNLFLKYGNYTIQSGAFILLTHIVYRFAVCFLIVVVF